MASPSKEDHLLQLLLENSPLKQWRFDEIQKTAQVTKSVANKWLRKFVSEGLILYVKEKGRFPYYSAGSNNSVYYSMKRIYALNQLHACGLLPVLLSLHSAKTVIIFGSMVQGDWYKDSDVDIFVYGNIRKFEKRIYEDKLKKRIELHVFKNQKDIRAVKSGLLRNVFNGYVVKGRIQDFAKVSE